MALLRCYTARMDFCCKDAVIIECFSSSVLPSRLYLMKIRDLLPIRPLNYSQYIVTPRDEAGVHCIQRS